MAPGPTFIIPRGTEAIVRFINNANLENSVHLHGSASQPPWDGWGEDITLPGQYKDYYYSNSQAGRMQWYHDHAVHIVSRPGPDLSFRGRRKEDTDQRIKTSENANQGQAGAWIIADPAEDALGLPCGYGEFDIPLILSSKFYNPNGTILSTVGEEDSYWGDVIHVVRRRRRATKALGRCHRQLPC